jgi:hypothetical protein
VNKLGLKVAVLVFSCALAFQAVAYRRHASGSARPALATNDAPPRTWLVIGDGARRRNRSLQDVLPSTTCAVVVVYDSTCEFCQELAAVWTHTAVVGHEGRVAPVFWIARTSSDTGRAKFMLTNGLPGPLLAFKSPEDARRWAIWRTPEIFAVLPGARYGGRLTRSLINLELPDECPRGG